MTHAIPRIDPYSVRGWCPSATRPMQTGDGLIVRLSPRGRSLTPEDLAAIAGIAERYGNGLIDLTRRGNVQLRGITAEGLPQLWPELARSGLLSEGAANVLVGPLAGVDPNELVDSARLADALAGAIARDPVLSALPAKFAFIVDGGGNLPLDAEAADIRLRAMLADERLAIAIAVDRPGAARYLGSCTPHEAAGAAAQLAARFVELRPNARARMRDLPDAVVDSLAAHAGLSPLDGAPAPSPTQRPLGPVRIAGEVVAVGIAAAFGRLTAADLRALADRAGRAGITSFRVSPWRSICALTNAENAARAVAEWAHAAGFITDADDPLLAIDACPGAPACAAASVDTRTAARALAPLLKGLGVRSCHVSGCSKGCARSSAADLTLVGAGGSFGLVHRGTARSTPSRFVRPEELASHPHLLKPA